MLSRAILILMIKKPWILGLFCAVSTFLAAQDSQDSLEIQQLSEVVVSATKFPVKKENSGKVITKINQEELQKLQGKSISEIINFYSGIEINGSKSNAGQNLNYYIRGGRNRQVLVLIDGIPVTDPSQIANDYDLRLLDVNQIDNIEILKGSSSTLYGSGAATAVINIKFKESTKKQIATSLKSTMGTNQSQENDSYDINDFKNSASFNGTLGKFSYLAGFSNEYVNGLSAVVSGTEKDIYNAVHGNLKLGYTFNNLNINAYGLFDKFKADFDDGFYFLDADNQSKTNQYRLGLSSKYKYQNGDITLNLAYNNVDRNIASSFPAKFYSNSYIGDFFNRYKFGSGLHLVLGVNAQRNEMESFSIPYGSSNFQQSINPENAEFNIVDPYVNMVYDFDFGLTINAGVRLNNHSEYGSHWVYSANPSFKKETGFGYLKGMISYSTAYITPSLYQLFETSYGNDDLKPEENQTLELGLEVGVSEKLTSSIVFFNRWENNFIDFVDLGGFIYQYNNVDEDFKAYGLEFNLDYRLTKSLKLNTNATYTKVDKDLNLRIPEIKVNAWLEYQFRPNTYARLSYQYNDDREDAYFNNTTFLNEEITLKSYSLLDIYISHQIIENKLTVFGNLTNIFNENYAELYGYTTKGRNVYLGFNINL